MSLSAARADTTLIAALNNPATPFVQLHTGSPGADGTANVAVDNAAAAAPRKAVTFGAPGNHATNTERRCLSTDAPTWTAAQLNAGQTITHFSIWSAVTAGNVEHIAALTESKVVGSEGASFAAGALEAAITVFAKP